LSTWPVCAGSWAGRPEGREEALGVQEEVQASDAIPGDLKHLKGAPADAAAWPGLIRARRTGTFGPAASPR
jgi:hypothetical protein